MARFMRKKDRTEVPQSIQTHPLESERLSVEVIRYNADYYTREAIEDVNRLHIDPGHVYWINVNGIQDKDVIGHLISLVDVDPFVVRNIQYLGQRPKLDQGESHVYLTLKMLSLDPESDEIVQEQVSFILKDQVLITFQERAGDVFESVRKRLSQNGGAIRNQSADYLLYTLLDAVVNHHFLLLERVEDRVESLEDKILEDKSINLQREIQQLRRDLLIIKTSIWPLRDVICSLINVPFLTELTRDRLRDTDNQSDHIIDLVTAYREMITGIYDTYLSNSNSRLNRVITTLTVISTIFIPLTFLTGVYGMNFHYMPEIDWPYAYATFWLVSLALSAGMLIYFRRKKWI